MGRYRFCSARLLPLALVLAAGCGGGGDSSSGGTQVLGAAEGGSGGTCSTTYPNGHPLNWHTTDAAVLALEEEIVELVNNYRVAMSEPRPALIHEELMRSCARGHSRHMRNDSHGFWSHVNPEGDPPWPRMNANGIVYTTAGENIAAGYPTPEDTFNGWLASPGHRANIEEPRYRRTGVGYQPNPEPGPQPYSNFYTQIFAGP